MARPNSLKLYLICADSSAGEKLSDQYIEYMKQIENMQKFKFSTLLTFIMLSVVCFSDPVFANTVYVNDQLRVGIRQEPNNDAAPIKVVSTGDKLELLDNEADYVLVRTSDGVEGWMKSIYTTTNVPAVVQLKALSKTAGGSSVRIKEMARQIDLMESANQVLSKELEELKSEKNRYKLQVLALENGQPSGGWIIWLGGIIVFTVASFILGMYWYRNQAMKRLGGLRIYF